MKSLGTSASCVRLMELACFCATRFAVGLAGASIRSGTHSRVSRLSSIPCGPAKGSRSSAGPGINYHCRKDTREMQTR